MSDPWLTLKAFQEIHSNNKTLVQRQTDWLIACLKHNQYTQYGQRYAFASINSIRDYQDRVPMVRYLDLKPYIERTALDDGDMLFRGRPVAFEQTGGSGGGSKLIPYSNTSLEDFRQAMLPWLGNLVASHGISSGSVYLSLSPATRQMQTTAGGIPFGLPDGAYLGAVAGQALMGLSAVPAWVGRIPDVAQWQLATLYWLLRRQELVLISLWSPSFFLQLFRGLDERRAELEELLNNGGQIADQPLSADKAALKRLREYQHDHDSRHLWPGLILVSCWMDGASRPLAETLRQRLPQAQFQAKGLLSTEGVVTVPSRNGAPLLAAESGFYEFLPDNGKACCAWELEENRDYEVVLTTAGGLYRYRTGDLVRYVGLVQGLPELHFLGRNDHTSDLVGEKLTEAFVAQCLEGTLGFCMLAPVKSSQPHYTLIIDDNLAKTAASQLAIVEGRLMTNPQYAYARKLGQLAPLTVTPHADPLQAYMTQASLQQRLGDVKVPALLPLVMEVELFMENVL